MFGKNCYREINEQLNRAFKKSKALIAVHRGVWGGNVLGNTIPAFRMAGELGADMFELDVSKSTDGILYAFHDGSEKHMLGIDTNIETLSSSEISKLTYFNTIGEPSGIHIELLESVISFFRDGELYNVDRAWDKLSETIAMIKKYPWAIKQALIKAPVKEATLEFLNECPEKIMYMPIVYSMRDIEKALSYPEINMVGMELIAGKPEDELFQDDAIKYVHSKQLFVWANAITLSGLSRHILFGGLDDNTALFKSRDGAWGKLLRMGIDIIQTDWPCQLKNYRDTYFPA